MRKRKIGNGVLGIVMAVLVIVILWFMIKIPIRIVKNMQEIITYTDGCEVAEGNVCYVTRKYIDHSGKPRYSYSLYSGGITYTDQEGTEHNFVSQYYKKKLKHPGKVKVIYDPKNPEKQDIAYFEIAVLRYAPYHLNPELGNAMLSCVIYLFFAAFPFYVAWECYMECMADKKNKATETAEHKKSKKERRKAKELERKTDWELIQISGIFTAVVIIAFVSISSVKGININPLITDTVTATVDNIEFYKNKDKRDGYVEEYQYEVSYVTQDGEERAGRLYTEGKKYKVGEEVDIVCWKGIRDDIEVFTPSQYKRYVSFVWIFVLISFCIHILTCISYYLTYKTLHKSNR